MSYGSLQKLAHIIRDRRTVKMFQQKAVDQNIILDAIDIARWAPNHHVTEPWHFYLLNKVVIKKSNVHYEIKLYVTQSSDKNILSSFIKEYCTTINMYNGKFNILVISNIIYHKL